MRRIILYAISLLLGASLGATLLPAIWKNIGNPISWLNRDWVNASIGALIFLILTLALTSPLLAILRGIDRRVSKISLSVAIYRFAGTILGLLVGLLIGLAISFLRIPTLSNVLSFLAVILFGYIGYSVFDRRGEEIFRTILRQGKKEEDERGVASERIAGAPKLLDTSVIIDGRIFDIIASGFLEGALIVPEFVVLELQALSDSGDALKRAKGRRGLDYINEHKTGAHLEILDKDYTDIREVDTKLLRLATELSAKLITNDFNLNKVAKIQGIQVLNINDLANAVKQQVVVGEELEVNIVRAGSERHQGIGFLPDGTMIVVEDTDQRLNEKVLAIVTKSLQTSAGRMVFADFKK